MPTSKAKRWQILSKKKGLKKEEILKTLLINRGLKTKKEIENFFTPPDPYKLTAKKLGINQSQLGRAVKRIKKAILRKEKIIIYGDFDADGICATAILWETLYALGADALPFIPSREEGYGLKVDRIDQFKNKGVSLIVTVDLGIVASRQAERAKKIGVDLIITDHHALGKKKPKAEAIVHTTKLSGAGVSWFLACQLSKSFKDKKALPGLDLVTIATVTDMMPFTGVNRAIVKHGIKAVRKTRRVGLLGLYQAAGLDMEKIGTFAIGFIIGPKINAAGRIDDPMEALRLLCTKDKGRAFLLASKLEQQNKARQDLTKKSYLFARDLWLEDGDDSRLIFLSHESFEEGIVGLVASRLVEEFYRPAVIVSLKGDKVRASARSIAEFDMIEAIRTCSDILSSHGGHPMAAGFSIEKKKLEKLKKRLKKLAREKLDGMVLSPTVKIDLEVDFSNLTFDLFGKIEKFAPFGLGNPAPTFLTRGAVFKDVRTVGLNDQHLKAAVFDQDSGIGFSLIGFGLGNRVGELSPEAKVDLVYTLTENVWNGKKNLELKLKDFRAENGKEV